MYKARNGKEFSDETIEAALKAYVSDLDKTIDVPLKAGDVTEFRGDVRIIIDLDGTLYGIDLDGKIQSDNSNSHNAFFDYEKTGKTLREIWEPKHGDNS